MVIRSLKDLLDDRSDLLHVRVVTEKHSIRREVSVFEYVGWRWFAWVVHTRLLPDITGLCPCLLVP